MSWFKRTPPKHPQEIQVPRVQFVGEQDGPSEQLLKARLSEFFKRDRSVLAAYLAQVDIGGQMGVALCLKTQFGPDRGLAEKIGTIFKTIFNAQVHLDIMFPSATQEAELIKMCRPFFLAQEND
ncbi:MAG: enhanced serine sensitivity protein SseB C-terminal domain-containing protein [Opitutaceae bacterium]